MGIVEGISGFVTAVGATLTGVTVTAPDTLTVRKAVNPRLLNVWVDAQTTAGTLRIFSPLMHDAAQGLRFDDVLSEVDPLMPYGFYQPLQSQDVLTVQLSGSAGGGDIDQVGLLLYYDSLPGSEGRFIDEAATRERAVQPFDIENTLALGTGGNWSGEEAINAEFDLTKAETDYALVGYQTDAECTSIGWRGPDTGNLRVSGPGNETDKHYTAGWFVIATREYGIPMIPVFNSANKAATLIAGAQDENGVDATVDHIYMQLTPEAAKQASAASGPTSRSPGGTSAPVSRPGPIPVGGRVPPVGILGGVFAPRQVT